jgi:hypothetical protein
MEMPVDTAERSCMMVMSALNAIFTSAEGKEGTSMSIPVNMSSTEIV